MELSVPPDLPDDYTYMAIGDGQFRVKEIHNEESSMVSRRIVLINIAIVLLFYISAFNCAIQIQHQFFYSQSHRPSNAMQCNEIHGSRPFPTPHFTPGLDNRSYIHYD